MKKVLTVLIIILLTISLFPSPASANSPPPAPWYTITLENLPEDAFYVDLLIPLSEDDPCYQEPSEDILPASFPENAEIITYREDGYRSYTFHYRDAVSNIFPGRNHQITFFSDQWGKDHPEHMEDIENRGSFRLAILDQYGSILKVSATHPANQRYFLRQVTNSFRYDAATDTLTRTTLSIMGGFLGLLILIGCSIIVTCLLEVLAAIPFGLFRRYGWMILRTNLASQIIMWLLFLNFSLLPFLTVLVIVLLEIGVYILEYQHYRHKMPDIPRRKCLIYTISANTVSLVFGPVLLFVIYGMLL